MKVSKEFLANEGLLIKNEPRIVCIRHNSMTFDFSSLNKKLDHIFIDGDYSYGGYLQRYQKRFAPSKKMKNPSSCGMIVVSRMKTMAGRPRVQF